MNTGYDSKKTSSMKPTYDQAVPLSFEELETYFSSEHGNSKLKSTRNCLTVKDLMICIYSENQQELARQKQNLIDRYLQNITELIASTKLVIIWHRKVLDSTTGYFVHFKETPTYHIRAATDRIMLLKDGSDSNFKDALAELKRLDVMEIQQNPNTPQYYCEVEVVRLESMWDDTKKAEFWREFYLAQGYGHVMSIYVE
jgi:hypothetical protein